MELNLLQLWTFLPSLSILRLRSSKKLLRHETFWFFQMLVFFQDFQNLWKLRPIWTKGHKKWKNAVPFLVFLPWKLIDLTLLCSIHQQLINMKKWALILNKSLYHILSDLNFDHKEEFLFELINLNGFILYKFTDFPLIPFWEIFLNCCLFCWDLIDFYGQITGNDESAVISYSKTRTITIKTQK